MSALSGRHPALSGVAPSLIVSPTLSHHPPLTFPVSQHLLPAHPLAWHIFRASTPSLRHSQLNASSPTSPLSHFAALPLRRPHPHPPLRSLLRHSSDLPRRRSLALAHSPESLSTSPPPHNLATLISPISTFALTPGTFSTTVYASSLLITRRHRQVSEAGTRGTGRA